MILAVFIAACTLYANLSFLVSDPADFRYFPPFTPGVDVNATFHLGGEHYGIAVALVNGRGFADPFFARTGPTAWMPPVYPAVLATLLWMLGSAARVVIIVVLLQGLVLVMGGLLVEFVSRRTLRSLPPWVPLVFYGAWLVAYFDWFFQMTHDTWIIMLILELTMVGWLTIERWGSRRVMAPLWGLLGGVGALTSPMAALAWGAATASLATRWNRRALTVSVALAAAVTLSWVARNAVVFDRLVLVKSNLAYDFYSGNFAPGDGVYDEGSFDSHPMMTVRGHPDASYATLGETAFVEGYRDRVLAEVRARPLEVPRRALNRLLAATVLHRPYRPSYAGNSGVFAGLVHPLPALGAIVLLVLRRGDRTAVQNLVLCMCAAFLAPYIVVAFYARYLLPLTPLLVLAWSWGQTRSSSESRRGTEPAPVPGRPEPSRDVATPRAGGALTPNAHTKGCFTRDSGIA